MTSISYTQTCTIFGVNSIARARVAVTRTPGGGADGRGGRFVFSRVLGVESERRWVATPATAATMGSDPGPLPSVIDPLETGAKK
jgi:hypothetical protein